MRKLGKQFTQKGLGKKVKKKPNEIIAELTEVQHIGQKKKITRKALAKKLGVSDRTLRSYKKYFASLENPKIKLTKNDRRPPKKVLAKLNKTATKYKIEKQREAGSVFDKEQVETLKNIISKETFDSLKTEMKSKTFFGFLIRINILFITKQGSFNDWLTYATSITKYKDLDQFISDQIYKKVTKKNSILGFEIIEVVINITTTEYEPNKPKAVRKSQRKK